MNILTQTVSQRNNMFTKSDSNQSVDEQDTTTLCSIDQWMGLYEIRSLDDLASRPLSEFNRIISELQFWHANYYMLSNQPEGNEQDQTMMKEYFDTSMSYESYSKHEVKLPVIELRKLYDAFHYIFEDEDELTYINEFGVLCDKDGENIDIFDPEPLKSYFSSKKKEYDYSEVTTSIYENSMKHALLTSTNYHDKISAQQNVWFTRQFLQMRAKLGKIVDEKEREVMVSGMIKQGVQIVRDDFLDLKEILRKKHLRGQAFHTNTRTKVPVSAMDAILKEFSLLTKTIMKKEKVKDLYYKELTEKYASYGVLVCGSSNDPNVNAAKPRTVVEATTRIRAAKKGTIVVYDLDCMPAYTKNEVKEGEASSLTEIMKIMEAVYSIEGTLVIVINTNSLESRSFLTKGLVPEMMGWLSYDCNMMYFVPKWVMPEVGGLFTRPFFTEQMHEWRSYKIDLISALSSAYKKPIAVQEFIMGLKGKFKLKYQPAEIRPKDITDEIPQSLNRDQFNFINATENYSNPFTNELVEEESDELQPQDSEEAHNPTPTLFTPDDVKKKKMTKSYTTLGGIQPKSNGNRGRGKGNFVGGRRNRGRGKKKKQVYRKNDGKRNSLRADVRR
jgi:hypothetical protein